MVLRPWSTARQRGFALLIVVTLLAFITLLLLGLAAFTRIETSVAGNMQRQAQARENALLALNLAVGQLQTHAGPDRRVTATAEAFSNRAGTSRYVGVWRSDPADDPDGDPLTPLTWLVSGNELVDATGAKLPLAVTPSMVTTALNGVALVSANTSGTANDVLARLVPLTATGVPGASPTASTTIGRYAWWVGDNGVKADVAPTDVTSRLNYPPFVDSVGAAIPAARTRLLQQTGLGAGPFNTSSRTAPFDPRDTVNLALATNVLTTQQIPFLRTSANAALGVAALRSHYHNWTVGNHAVLARTNAPAGAASLRNDLSLNPAALGTAFVAWADYPTYMESPTVNPLAASLAQPANALRRRYQMTPAVMDANGSQFGIAPVLSYLALAFSLRNDSLSNPVNLECSMRCVVELWNPYTAALVPEDLEVLITGLNDVDVRDSNGVRRHVDLQNAMGDTSLPNNPVRFSLPWTISTTDDQYASWLPGRVYNWSAESNTTQPANAGNRMEFDRRALQTSGTGVVRRVGASVTKSTTANFVARVCFLNRPTTLRVELRRASDGATLATFQSPPFNPFPSSGSTPLEVDRHSLDFAFVFRLADPTVDGTAWLQTPTVELRNMRLGVGPATPFIQPGNAADPSLFVLDSSGTDNVPTFAVGNPSLLLDRYPGSSGSPAGTSPDEDVPVFELPRAPLLSVAQLQHLALPALQPFWVGQSAAAGGPMEWSNTLFDQHFFSGLGSGSNWTDITRPLPNTLARVLRRKPDGSDVVATDFDAMGLSAKHLLQGGAFNLNSIETDAWAAVLRSVRFPSGREFAYLDAADATGTNTDTATATLAAEAAFPRFSQSAQEIFKTTLGYIQSEPGTSTNTTVRTDYYRRGFRTLDAATVTALAQKIAAAVKARLAVAGPFVSVEEFLNPANGVGTPSLLEQAILDLNLNDDPANPGTLLPFSSAFLTQADLMTALSPVLFARSDTFTIRAYGEAVNPATGATEGKAWCEALVQRVPEPFEPAIARQPTDDEYRTPPGNFGRRFKVISFRWLTKSDI